MLGREEQPRRIVVEAGPAILSCESAGQFGERKAAVGGHQGA